MPVDREAQGNDLLAAVPVDVQDRLFPKLERVRLPLGRVLYESGAEMNHVYFPIDAIVSLLYVMEDGASAEISVVGHEGIVGIALITQMAQTAVCNRHHSIDQQLCRWILLSLDRLPSNQLTMTQELIANMLGVRREGVTEAAGKLQRPGVIRYQRGHITVVDRPKLERLSCECYAVVKKETDRLLLST
jgi:CRP-like cAMP-binding protein